MLLEGQRPLLAMQRKRTIDDASLDSEQPHKKKKSSDLNFSIHSSSQALSSLGPTYNANQGTLPELPEIRDISLADVPFTHRGFLGGNIAEDANVSYDRLEFLGDAYLEIIATRVIFPRYPHYQAGKLSQTRQMLVRNDTLAVFSLAYGFDKRARLPKTLQTGSSGGQSKTWNKTMADIFEAYVAAVIISDSENGFSTAERWLTELWEPILSSGDEYANLNGKVQLATKIMGKGVKIAYQDEGQPGLFKTDGKILFQVGAYVTGWGWENAHLGSGKGWNKNEAGCRAAMEAISNPLTAQIAAIKRDFDFKTAQEKESQASLANSSKT